MTPKQKLTFVEYSDIHPHGLIVYALTEQDAIKRAEEEGRQVTRITGPHGPVTVWTADE